jgi:O-antigen ligase
LLSRFRENRGAAGNTIGAGQSINRLTLRLSFALPLDGAGRAAQESRAVRVPLLPLIEPAVYGLLAGTLLSQPLRDVSAVILLGLLLFERATRDDEETGGALPRAWVIAVGAFLGANLISAWASHDPAASFQQLRFYAIGLLVFLGVRRLVAAGRWRSIATVVLALIVVFSADSMWQWLHGQSLMRQRAPLWGRFQGSLVYPSDVSMLPILLPIGASITFAGGRWRTALALATVMLVTPAVSLSGTRSAWIALFLVAIAAGWQRRRVALGLALCGAVMAVSLLSMRTAVPTAPRRLLSAATYRDEKRLSQWQAAIALFREAPILGKGPHSFRAIVRSRHGEKSAVGRVDIEMAPYPHDIYIEALCGTGIVGLAALLVLLGRGFRDLGRRWSDVPARAAFTSLGVFAAIGVFDLSLVKDWVQLCFWLPLGIAAGLSADRAAPAAAGPTVRTPPR